MDPNDEPTFACIKCWDEPNGWQQRRICNGHECERRKPHAPHTFTMRCPCWLQRNADALRLAQQDAIAKNKPVPAECRALAELMEGCYRWA